MGKCRDPSTPPPRAESLTAAPTSLPSTSPPLPRPEVLPRRESDSSVALERWQPSCDSPTDAIVGMCVWRGVASPHESFAESPRVEHPLVWTRCPDWGRFESGRVCDPRILGRPGQWFCRRPACTTLQP